MAWKNNHRLPLFLLLALLIGGCGNNRLQRATVLAEQFYTAIQKHDFAATLPLRHASLVQQMNDADWIALLEMRREWGSLQSYKLTKQTETQGQIILEYETRFDTIKYYEELCLVPHTDQMQIVRYTFDPRPLAEARRQRDNAHKFVEGFFEQLKAGNHQTVVRTLLDEEAIKATPAEKWLALFTQKDTVLGEIQYYQYSNMKHRRFERADTYILQYETSYAKYSPVREEIILIQRGDNFKMLSYNYQTVNQQ